MRTFYTSEKVLYILYFRILSDFNTHVLLVQTEECDFNSYMLVVLIDKCGFDSCVLGVLMIQNKCDFKSCARGSNGKV